MPISESQLIFVITTHTTHLCGIYIIIFALYFFLHRYLLTLLYHIIFTIMISMLHGILLFDIMDDKSIKYRSIGILVRTRLD